MKKLPQPTASELKILGVLWEHGPSTVREVHEQIQHTAQVSYTTVLKQLQIMAEKGLVARDTAQRAHVYRPVLSESQTQKALLGDFVNRVYDGSASRLVMQALGMSRPASKEELGKIEALIQQLKNGSDPNASGPEE